MVGGTVDGGVVVAGVGATVVSVGEPGAGSTVVVVPEVDPPAVVVGVVVVDDGTVEVVVVVPMPSGNWSEDAEGGLSVAPLNEYTAGKLPAHCGSSWIAAAM